MPTDALYNYINQTINPHFVNQLPTFLCIHGLDTHLAFGNQPALQVLGFAKGVDYTDTAYQNLPCQLAAAHEACQSQDEYVFSQQSAYRFLSYSCYANHDWKIILGEKTPLYDQNQQLIGLVSHWKDVTQDRLFDVGRLLIIKNSIPAKQKQFSFHIQDVHNQLPIKLSKRQSETLFYLLRGYQRSDIAELLQVSSRTIETYIEQLKNKFTCDTRKQLIEHAMHLGYTSMLPASLLG